ncbi:uncharacterized protein LOC129312404 isoform X1 [Prosopis cineraria]|uniref:uncharacterized protein LOC129312404 isoform X1 n=1 Tax=Prosopis cineraria TaxID=364024 RepID=UPI00240F2B94|nr:uncharacterized protein LOC129312404 isoform X1 [Prosopis cineraria]
MMAVDLQSGESTLPSHFLPDQDHHVLSAYPTFSDHTRSAFDPHEFGFHISSPVPTAAAQSSDDKDDDFIFELTREMAHFMFQDDDQSHLSGTGSSDLEMSWDSTDSSQSTLWSPLGSNQGSPEGPSLEPTPPATPCDGKDSCRETAHDVVGMLEKMNLDGRGHSKYLHGYGNCSFNQALIDQQIRAVQLSRLNQQQIMKRALADYPASQAQTEPGEQIQQVQKKGKGSSVGLGNARRNRPLPLFTSNNQAAPLQEPQNQQQASGSGTRAVFRGGSGSRTGSCGTGVFLPRVNTAPPESRKKSGCSTVLIPARVVQALQLHFDQMAATAGPKAGGFPPLQEVLVSNKDGMFSLQKRQSRKEPASLQNETRLPQEWTY